MENSTQIKGNGNLVRVRGSSSHPGFELLRLNCIKISRIHEKDFERDFSHR